MDNAITNTDDTSSSKRRRWHWTTRCLALLMLILFVIINLGGDTNPLTDGTDYGWPWVYREYQPPRGSMFFPSTPEPARTWYYFWPLVGNIFVGGLLIATSSYLWERRIRRLNGWFRFTIRDWFWLCVFFAVGYSWFANLYHDNRVVHELLKHRHLTEEEHANWVIGLMSEQNDLPYDWFWEALNIPEEFRPQRQYALTYTPRSDDDLRTIAKLTSLRSLDIEFTRNVTPEGWRSLQKLSQLTRLNIQVTPLGHFDSVTEYAEQTRGETVIDAATLEIFISLPKLKRMIITVQRVDEQWLTVLRKVTALKEIEISSEETQLRSFFFPVPGKGLDADEEAKFREYFLSPPMPTGTDHVDHHP